MRKGFFFTMDALIAATIISFAFLSIAIVKPAAPSENTGYERMHYITEDAMQLFGMTKLAEINSTVYGEILDETNITQDYLNKSVLETVGFLWADGKTQYVKNISEDFFPGIIPKDYAFAISVKDITGEKKTLYSSTGSPPESGTLFFLTKASRIVSGYVENTTATGYTSRAWATKITKNSSKVFEFNPEGGSFAPGASAGVNIKKTFFLNATAIYNATLYVSLHTGTSGSASLKVDGNSVSLGTDRYSQSKEEDGKSTRMYFYVVDVTAYLTASGGWHTVEFDLFGQGTHTHMHPGTKLEVEYETNDQRTLTGTYAERKYFDDIKSGTSGNKDRGAWAIMPVNVPKTADVKNVTLHLRALNVDNDTGKDNVLVYFNNMSVLNVSNPPSTYDTYVNLTSYVNSSKNITNVLSVYVNSMDNSAWGKDGLELYSNPQTDENASSYVYIEYDWPKESKFKYGYIEVTPVDHFNGTMGNPKAYAANFSGDEITNSYLHIAQLDSDNVTVTVEPEGEEKNTVFVSPRLRAMPSTLYIDPSYYNITKNNTINVSDACPSSAAGPCPILPESSFEYNIFVPSQVGYGSVFNTSQAAQDDAINRLKAVLGKYVSAEEIGIDAPLTTGSVPWMYGPAIITLEVWKS